MFEQVKNKDSIFRHFKEEEEKDSRQERVLLFCFSSTECTTTQASRAKEAVQ